MWQGSLSSLGLYVTWVYSYRWDVIWLFWYSYVLIAVPHCLTFNVFMGMTWLICIARITFHTVHSRMWHGSVPHVTGVIRYVTWLLWNRSFLIGMPGRLKFNIFMYVTWLTCILRITCHMSHSRMWHGSIPHVPWVIHICDMAPLILIHFDIGMLLIAVPGRLQFNIFMYVTWLMCILRITCNMSHSRMWNGSFDIDTFWYWYVLIRFDIGMFLIAVPGRLQFNVFIAWREQSIERFQNTVGYQLQL